MAMAFYYEELPLAMVVAAQERIEAKLHDEECRLALGCRWGAAYIELKLANGERLYVARDRKWNGKEYIYCAELFNDDEILEHITYKKAGTGYKRLDGYEVEPLFMIAVKAIRLGNKAKKEV